MKSLTTVAILIGACAIFTVACESKQNQPTGKSNQNLTKNKGVEKVAEKAILPVPQPGPNLIAVDPIYYTTQLHLASLIFNSNHWRTTPPLPNVKYKGVAAFESFRAILFDNDKFNNPHDRIEVSTNHHGKVKYNGSAIELEEIELIDDNMNNIYATKGRQIFRLTYVVPNGGLEPYFNATLVYTIPQSNGYRVISTICPDPEAANRFRVYYFQFPMVIPASGVYCGNFRSITISNASSTPIIGLPSATSNIVLAGLTTTTPVINSFRSTLNNSMYVTVNGVIRRVGTGGVMTTISSTLIPTVAGTTSYQKIDCAFGNY